MKNNVKIQDDTQSRQSCVSVSVTDLRIGNYYIYDDDTIKLDGSLLATYLQNDTDLYLYPVLLTEKWLLKFGFPSIMNNGVFQVLNFLGNIYAREKSFFFEYVFLKVEIKYIHELQDLYRTLTGSELQIGSITEH